MAIKHRLDWAQNHWDITIETGTGTARLTLDEFLDMADDIRSDLLSPRDAAASPQRPDPQGRG